MSGSAKATVFIDNERVIVTEYRFSVPELASPRYDYVMGGLVDGKLKIVARRARRRRQDAAAPYFRREGVEHDVVHATGLSVLE